jgi:hypothetical protein
MQRNREHAVWLLCMLVASVGLVWSLWVVPYIPTTDGPQHVLSSHIENHYSDAGSVYPEFYRILPQFAGKGFALLFGPLEAVLPWRVALRVALSIIAVAFAWGFALVVLSLDGGGVERRPTAMLGFFIALPYSLYMGLFQFVVGSTLGLYILAFVLRRPPSTNARRAVLALLLLVQGVFHIFTAILTGVVVLVLALVAAPKGQRLREVGRIALVGTPAGAVFALTVVGRNLRASEQQNFSWAMGERFTELSRWFVPGPDLRGWPVLLLAVAGIASTLLRGRRGTAAPSPPMERALGWIGLVFLVLVIFAPLHIPGWQFFAPRFCILAVVLGLALVRLPSSSTPGSLLARVAPPALAALCLGWDLVSANVHRALANGCADALAGLDVPMHFEGPRLPIIVDPSCGTPRDSPHGPVPRASLAYNIPLLYLVDHGGIGTRMFNGTPSIHAIEFTGSRRPPPPPLRPLEVAQSRFVETDPKLREAAFTELAADAMAFEGVHVVGGRPEDFALFNRRGYVTEFEQGSTFIGRFEGCPAELLLPPEALAHEPVYVEYGLFSRAFLTPEPRSFGAKLVPRDTPVRDGAVHVPRGARPCGEIWVRAFWDADGSSSFTPADRVCTNGQKWQGRVRANVTKEQAAVACLLPP